MKSLAYLFISLVIVGCSREQSHNALLAQAEQVVFELPDSALRLLAPCWTDTSLTEADQARFGLLYTEALHRSGLTTGTDSLILISRRYYEKTGDEAHLARALLHHGIILYKRQMTHEAVLTMKRAEQLAAKTDNPAFCCYLYSVLGDINDNVGNYTQTLRYYRQALAAAQQSGNDEWRVRALNNLALTYDLLGETDSLKHYTDLARPYAQRTSGEVRATYLANQASLRLRLGKRQEAKAYLEKAQAMYSTDRAAKLLADIYVQEGDTFSASQQWYQLANSFSPDISIGSYRRLIEYLNQRGDTRAVAEYSQRLNSVYHDLYEHNDAAGIIDIQTQYDKQQKALRQYRMTIALLLAIILLSAATGGILWYNHRRIDRLNTRFLESQQQYALTRSELTQMRQQKEREARENSRQMKSVIAHLHTTANRGQSASDEDMTALAQLSYALSPDLQALLSPLNQKEQHIALLIRHNFQPIEIASLTISTPQSVTNIRVRLLKKLFGETGGAKDFDARLRSFPLC